MKDYLIKYRPFLVFLGKFFFTYLLLIIIYQLFLSQYDAEKFEADGMTHLVADQTQMVLKAFDYNAKLIPLPGEPSILVTVDRKPIVRVVEGCNAISIMILFTAFIVAFSGKFLRTFGFIVVGILSIHILNVLRIPFLVMGMIHYPQYENLLHGVIFPLIIYGFIFLLWVLWVNKFQRYAKKNT
ncbi:MAG: exosortase family protein XrtF [Flavobacterium sp.]|nr:MAG: exosortase family protein XrtF [Flavobacterium sp.]